MPELAKRFVEEQVIDGQAGVEKAGIAGGIRVRIGAEAQGYGNARARCMALNSQASDGNNLTRFIEHGTYTSNLLRSAWVIR